MSELWLGVIILLVIAVGFVFIPYVVSLRRGVLVRETANVDIYKSQLAELDDELKAERISTEDHESLGNEIKRNLLLDTEAQTAKTNHEGGRWLMPVMALVVILVSVPMYFDLGAENEVAIAELLQRSYQKDYQQADAVELLERLMVQSVKTPEDVEVWYLIGRINFDLGQYDQAVLGFNGVLQYLPPEAKEDQAVAMAQLAQSMFFANGRKLDKATESLLLQALEINPRDNTSLGLLGVAAYDSQNYLSAVRYWNRLLKLLPPNNPNTQAIRGGIEKAKSQMSTEDLALLEKEIKDSIKASISVTVNIAGSIKNKLPKTADLFVLAKADQGPPMPLAVQRLSVDSWPITVTLDDSMAMMETLKLSEFENVIITARISKNGVGNATAGDLEGKINGSEQFHKNHYD